jgi:hypothetical protein
MGNGSSPRKQKDEEEGRGVISVLRKRKQS